MRPECPQHPAVASPAPVPGCFLSLGQLDPPYLLISPALPLAFSSFPVTVGDYGDFCNSQEPEGRNVIFQNSGLLPSRLILPPSLSPKPQSPPAACCHGYSNLYLLCLLNKLASLQPTSWLPLPL